MRGTWRGLPVLLVVAACGAADNRVDPADLELRDLLGLSPQVAAAWDPVERAAARHVLSAALDDDATDDAVTRALVAGRSADERLARTLAAIDGERAASGAGALALVRVTPAATSVVSAPRPGDRPARVLAGDEPPSAPGVDLWLADEWDATAPWGALPGRSLEVLAAIARAAGHDTGPVVIAPAPRLAVIAAYVVRDAAPPRLLVNPVLLAAIDPDDATPLVATTATVASQAQRGATPTVPIAPPTEPVGPPAAPGTGGNPYSFYGSVAECAYAQRSRCETCLATSSCAPVTDITDGNAECTMLAADGGRGYFLLCINLSLSIASVDRCTADEAPACPRDTTAASTLASLNQNAIFLDDATCGAGLDRCLADIYGAPPSPFPDLDGGVVPPDPPRTTTVSCGDSCDDSSNNGNCQASPDCDSSGPSCNNAFSCDSSCSSSNEQSGCGGNCEACAASDSSGGSTSAGCGGCDSDGSSGSGGGSCDGCSSDSSSGGGSCDGCSSDSSSGGGGCSGGSCGGDSGGGGCGGSGGNSCGGGGGGGSSCNVARRGPPASVTLLVAGLWAFLPVPAAALVRRRRRRRRRAEAGEPAAPAEATGAPDAAADEEVSS